MRAYDVKNIYNDKGRDTALEAYPQAIADNLGQNGELNELAFLAADFAHAEALSLLFEAGVSPTITDKYECNLLHHLAMCDKKHDHARPDGSVAAVAEMLLEHKVSYLRKDENEDMTCYHYAARHGEAEFVDTLASRGARLGITDKNGNTGIHIACQEAGRAQWYVRRAKEKIAQAEKSYEEAAARAKERNLSDEDARFYIQQSVNFTKEDAQSEYESCLALTEKYFRTVKAFAEGGVDIDEKNNSGRTALDIAIEKGTKKISAFLAGTLSGENDDAAIAAGGMTLPLAAEKGDTEAIMTIAAAGADLNAVKDAPENHFGGYTPLAIACRLMDYNVTEALLSVGCDPSFRDGRGMAAAAYLFPGDTKSFSFASTHYREDTKWESDAAKTIRALTGAGFDVNQAIDDDSNTLLILACAAHGRSPKEEALSELLRHNPDMNRANRFGVTALMRACDHDFYIMENYQIALLEGGADVSPADQNGDTALHYAARNDDKNGAKSLCDMLLGFGADANAVNNEGKTALDIAVEQQNEPLAKLLLNKM